MTETTSARVSGSLVSHRAAGGGGGIPSRSASMRSSCAMTGNSSTPSGSAAERRDEGIARIGAQHQHEVAPPRRRLQKRRQASDVVAAADGQRADPERIGPLAGCIHRARGDPDSGKTPRVPARRRAVRCKELRRAVHRHLAGLDLGDVVGEQGEPVRVVPVDVGLHETIGDHRRLVLRHAGGAEHTGGKRPKRLRIEALARRGVRRTGRAASGRHSTRTRRDRGARRTHRARCSGRTGRRRAPRRRRCRRACARPGARWLHSRRGSDSSGSAPLRPCGPHAAMISRCAGLPGRRTGGMHQGRNSLV